MMSMSDSEDIPERSSLDNAGVDRRTYEEPNCGNSGPHEQHFHTPVGGCLLNCPGSLEKERSIAEMIEDLPGDVRGLAAKLLLSSSEERNRTLKQLMESYRIDSWERAAELELIREAIEKALAGPYQPSASLLANLLFPHPEQVQARVTDKHPEAYQEK